MSYNDIRGDQVKESEGIQTVRMMQEFIEDHLDEKITLRQIAAHVGYSPWYCIRFFKEYTDKTPFEYLRMLRLTEAAKKLRDQECKIIDVAYDFYFESQEGFTRAFSKQFGITPKQYSLKKPPVKWFISFPVSPQNILKKGETTMSKKDVATIFTQVIEKPERKMLIKRGVKATEYFAYCEEVGCDIWGLLCSVKEAVDEPVGMWMPDQYRPAGTSQYVQGVEVPMDYKQPISEGMELITLKPYHVMIFQGQPYDDDNFEEEVMLVKEAIDRYNPTLYGFEWAEEEGPSFQYEPQGDRGYIEGRPVRKKS